MTSSACAGDTCGGWVSRPMIRQGKGVMRLKSVKGKIMSCVHRLSAGEVTND
jgi:hypothetical protein